MCIHSTVHSFFKIPIQYTQNDKRGKFHVIINIMYFVLPTTAKNVHAELFFKSTISLLTPIDI